jgi:hypothetical protein
MTNTEHGPSAAFIDYPFDWRSAMNEHDVIGFTTDQLVAAMGDAGIHCSLDRFRRLAIEIQRRALAANNLNEKQEKGQ